MDHALGLVFVAAMAFLLQQLGRRWPRAVEGLLGSWLLAYIFEAYRARWGELTWGTGLPLHLCDVLLLLALTMIRKPPVQEGESYTRSQAFELLFYGAWGGSIWAFITPDLYVGFPHWRYFEFFFGHGLIFWLLAHFYANRKCRLPMGSARRAWLWLVGYTLVVGSLDHIFGWNYGFLRAKPGAGSVLDFFGPWPIYVIVSLVIEGALFMLFEKLFATRVAAPEE